MVTLTNPNNVLEEPNRWVGLSIDTKPTTAHNGDEFVEMDTSKQYMYDEESADWVEITVSGGGGGGGQSINVFFVDFSANDYPTIGDENGNVWVKFEDGGYETTQPVSLVNSDVFPNTMPDILRFVIGDGLNAGQPQFLNDGTYCTWVIESSFINLVAVDPSIFDSDPEHYAGSVYLKSNTVCLVVKAFLDVMPTDIYLVPTSAEWGVYEQ